MTALNALSSRVLTTERIRNVDRLAIDKYGMHPLVLMENAARNCVDWILARFPNPLPVCILCGRGSNGGDGLVIARHLQLCGWAVRCFVLGPSDKLSTDCAANWKAIENEPKQNYSIIAEDTQNEIEVGLFESIQGAGLIVDAMLGSGATGNPRAPLSRWIEAANKSNAFRLAIDIPTGVCADSGNLGRPAFKADQTLTFVAKKPAMVQDNFLDRFGKVEVLPIGIPEALVKRLLAEDE